MEQKEKPTNSEESKHIFHLKEIVSIDAKNLIKRRTSQGKLIALVSTRFKATGFLVDEKGKRTKLEDQTLKGLRDKNVGIVKIPGIKDVSFAI